MYVLIGKMYVMAIISMFKKKEEQYIISLCPDMESARQFKMSEEEFNKKYGAFFRQHNIEFHFSTNLNLQP